MSAHQLLRDPVFLASASILVAAAMLIPYGIGYRRGYWHGRSER